MTGVQTCALPIWDLTITALNYKGQFIYHPSDATIGTSISYKFPYSNILLQRSGKLVWINGFKSEQLNNQFPIRRMPISRFTKCYFRDYDSLHSIIVVESHLNLLYKLPKGFKKYEESLT